MLKSEMDQWGMIYRQINLICYSNSTELGNQHCVTSWSPDSDYELYD